MEVPTDKAVQDVKDAIDQILGDLPGDIETPIVTRIDVEGQAIMTFAVASADMSIEELSWFVDDTITRALQGKPGIGRVDRYGGADREIRVELDPVRLDSFGVTAGAVSAQLRETNADLGAGRGEIGDQEQAIRTLGDAASADSLADDHDRPPLRPLCAPRRSRRGRSTPTRSSARSRASTATRSSPSPCSAPRARARSASPKPSTPRSTASGPRTRTSAITLVDDTVYYTYGNYEAALHTLIEGAILAVLVVLLFLRNWRATLITAVALPLSAIPTF